MKRLALFLVGVVLFAAALAFAAPTNVNMDGTVRWMKLGFFTGTTAAGTASNKVTTVLGASSAYDAVSITSNCTESVNIAMTGAKLGDVCAVGAPPAVGALSVAVTCYVSSADNARIKVCNPTVGAIDPASGTYYLRVFSGQ